MSPSSLECGFDSIRGTASKGPRGGGKGKGKATTSPELPLPMKEAVSPPSLEALMVDLTLFKELLLKDLEVVRGKGRQQRLPNSPCPWRKLRPLLPWRLS